MFSESQRAPTQFTTRGPVVPGAGATFAVFR